MIWPCIQIYRNQNQLFFLRMEAGFILDSTAAALSSLSRYPCFQWLVNFQLRLYIICFGFRAIFYAFASHLYIRETVNIFSPGTRRELLPYSKGAIAPSVDMTLAGLSALTLIKTADRFAIQCFYLFKPCLVHMLLSALLFNWSILINSHRWLC